MTPEEARGFVCPVRFAMTKVGDLATAKDEMCIGPACMWWVVSEIHLNSGNCAVREIIDWAEAISRDA